MRAALMNAEFSGIELEPGQEMVAPLLLLEAQENLQAFELAMELAVSTRRDGRIPWPSAGGSVADGRLGSTACFTADVDARRLYDQSAQILERVIQVDGTAFLPSQAQSNSGG